MIYCIYQVAGGGIDSRQFPKLKKNNWKLVNENPVQFSKWMESKEAAVKDVETVLGEDFALDRDHEGNPRHMMWFCKDEDALVLDSEVWDGRACLRASTFSLAELNELEAHLDDETEWDNIDGFWSAWGPRKNDRIRKLIRAAKALAILNP